MVGDGQIGGESQEATNSLGASCLQAEDTNQSAAATASVKQHAFLFGGLPFLRSMIVLTCMLGREVRQAKASFRRPPLLYYRPPLVSTFAPSVGVTATSETGPV